VTALGWPEPLRHALVNLFLNAAQASEGTGRVEVRVSDEGGRVAIRVLDDGPGIPAESREKVFAPFWTTKPSGTGLGLAYVRRVAETSGGSVEFENVPRGASVRLELPRAPD
jgi:signal transduction histidine kinase